ncbi:3-oxoacyl-[acyl-carrier-protein] reductase FabG [bacterium HR37]|nr:3-oxoacyl-[acyl-carrier-protein] reductase FabG [bacterium HR37]
MNINNKVAIVTGGAKRIGKEISLELAKLGANIVVNYNKSEKEAKEVVRLIEQTGKEAIAVKSDISNSKEANHLVDTTLNHFGRLDILVNNAAVFFKTPLFDITEKEWDTFMNVNLKGAFLCSQKAAKAMLDSIEGENEYGKIVNIADAAGGFKGWKDYIPYCVSKAGLIMLTKGLAKALAPRIHVNAVAPGPVLLPEYCSDEEKDKIAHTTLLKRLGTPRDIAKAVTFLIDSDYITGEVIVVDGGSLIK